MGRIYYTHLELEGDREILYRFIDELEKYKNKAKGNTSSDDYNESYEVYIEKERYKISDNMVYSVDENWFNYLFCRVDEEYKVEDEDDKAVISATVSEATVTELVRLLARRLPGIKINLIWFNGITNFAKYRFEGDKVKYFTSKSESDSIELYGINGVNLEKIEAECLRIINCQIDYETEEDYIDISMYEPF